jgi:hypothetical protein
MALARTAPAALGAVALAVALSACGATLPEPPLRNIAQIQTAIDQTLLAGQHVRGTAYCPTDVPAVKGQVFSCIVEIPGGSPAIFEVTVETPQGLVSYVRTQ